MTEVVLVTAAPAVQFRVSAAGTPGAAASAGLGSCVGRVVPLGEAEDKQQMFVLSIKSSSEKCVSKH